jgi:hypothetical protein
MNFTNSLKYIKESQLSKYSKCLKPDDFGYSDPCCVAFKDEYQYIFPLHSIIINTGDGIISFPLKNRNFEIKMYDCYRNKLKSKENVILPSTNITAVGSNGLSYDSRFYGTFIVNSKTGVFYCNSSSYTTAINFLKNILNNYENFESMNFNYIPYDDMEYSENIDMLKNKFNEVIENVKDKVEYKIHKSNGLSTEILHLPLSI